MAPPDINDRPTHSMTNVLVIDDSEITRAAVETLLRASGYAVRTMESPLGATSAIVQHEIDVLVCDLNMPVMSGNRFAEVLRANHRLSHVKLILMTGESGMALEKLGRELRADAVLRKHSLPDQLVPTIDRIMTVGEVEGDEQAVAGVNDRVLVVDDSLADADILRVRLEKMGYSVTTRRIGRGTLVAVMDADPSAIIVAAEIPDMPVSSVVEVLRESKITKGIPVILMGRLPQAQLTGIGQRCGASGAIPKDADEEAFERRFKAIMARH